MIKLIFAVIAVQGVWCAPAGLPFARYGVPSGSILAEESVPFAVPTKPAEYLPVPAPVGNLEAPKHAYEQGFLPAQSHPQLAYGVPAPAPQSELPNEEQKPLSHYPHLPEQEGNGSEIKEEAEILPGSITPLVQPAAPEILEHESLGSSDSPASTELLKPVPAPKPGPAPAAQINIPPNTSIKVQDGRGQYSHGFAGPDGTQVQETGHLISTDNGWEYVIAKEGSYSYNSPEGIPISVRYIADENGFRILSTSFAGR